MEPDDLTYEEWKQIEHLTELNRHNTVYHAKLHEKVSEIVEEME